MNALLREMQMAMARGAPAPSGDTLPTLVQSASAVGTTGTLTVTLPGPATASNLLVFSVAHTSGQTPTIAGETSFPRVQGNFRYLTVLYLRATGGETSFAISMGPSGGCSCTVSEWEHAQIGTTAQGSFVATSTAKTFGPSTAPASPNSVPLVLYEVEIATSSTFTMSSPWTGLRANTNPSAGYASQAAPDAAVSGTVTASTSAGFAWLILWLDPQ